MNQTTTGGSPAHTGSRGSRIVGLLAAGGAVALLVFALVLSPADRIQGEAVRLMYVHVPAAICMYLCVGLLGLGSALWLVKRTPGAASLSMVGAAGRASRTSRLRRALRAP